VKKGNYSIKITHLNVLRTIEEMYGLGYAGSSADSSAIPADYWLITTGVKGNKGQSGIPQSFKLFQNYPNPFNPTTTIRYQIPKEGFVTLKVYNLLGKEVKSLVNGYKNAGSYNISFDASEFPSGVYFYRLSTGNFNQTKKLVLLK